MPLFTDNDIFDSLILNAGNIFVQYVNSISAAAVVVVVAAAAVAVYLCQFEITVKKLFSHLLYSVSETIQVTKVCMLVSLHLGFVHSSVCILGTIKVNLL